MTSQTIDPTALHLALTRQRSPHVDGHAPACPWHRSRGGVQRLCKRVAAALQPHARREHICRLGPRETVISNPAKTR